MTASWTSPLATGAFLVGWSLLPLNGAAVCHRQGRVDPARIVHGESAGGDEEVDVGVTLPVKQLPSGRFRQRSAVSGWRRRV